MMGKKPDGDDDSASDDDDSSSDSASDDSSSGGFRSAAGVTGGDVVTPSPKDVNGGMVNVVDLIEVLICFGRAATPGCELVDVVTDGIVDVMDLLDLLTDLGTSCP